MAVMIDGNRPKGFFVNGEAVAGIAVNGRTLFRDTRRYALISTGTQYIDTGITLNDTFPYMRWEQRVQYTQIEAAVCLEGLFGAYDHRFFIGNDANRNYYVGRGINAIAPSKKLDLNWHEHQYWFSNSKLMNFSLDGAAVTSDNAINYPNRTSPGENIWLFNANHPTTDYHTSQKKEWCRFYKSDVLIRDFVAVPKGNRQYSSTPAPSNCLWCKVTRQYYENAGTGEFGIEEILE